MLFIVMRGILSNFSVKIIMKKPVVYLVGITILLQSCAKVYYSLDSDRIARSHKIIAIAPPRVSIASYKKVSTEAMAEQLKTESINFQREMYSWLLKRKMQGLIYVEIQDIDITNTKLIKAGYLDARLATPEDICSLIGVDGIITSNYSLSKPLSQVEAAVSEVAAIAMWYMIGFAPNTKSTTVDLSVHDFKTKKIIFNYNYTMRSSFGSVKSLVDGLMRRASKKLPYLVKNN
jgi:hypothetical protein